MQLVADRFVVRDDGPTVDLATGLRVWLVTAPAGSVDDQAAWSASCDAFQRLHHRAIAPLLDYGLLGRSERFEAWQCGPPWSGADVTAIRTRVAVGEFLRQAGLPPASANVRIHARHAAPAAVPSCAGRPRDVDSDSSTLPLAQRGMVTIARSVVAAFAEMFLSVNGSRGYAAALWGPAGSGKSVVVRELARLARINGFVPLAARLVTTACRELWRDRNVFVIDDHTGGGCAAMLHTVLASAMPHAMLIVGETEIHGIDGVPLARISSDALVAAITPAVTTDALDHQARRAAEQSRGWPGRFAQLLWSSTAPARADHHDRGVLSRVAEHAATYGGDEHVEAAGVPAPASAWPAPGELTALRRRMTAACADLDRGRHARGVRQLRHAIGGFARRDCWADAIDGSIALARGTLRRGRVREAQKILADARDMASRSGRESALLDVAILSGEAWTDAARLDEAEAVLAAARTTATAINDRARREEATVALARCLYWRGRYDEAAAALGCMELDPENRLQQRRTRWQARIASARGETATALQSATALVERCGADVPRARAAAHATAAWVRLIAGDVSGASAAALLAIADARRIHDPLRAIRARLLAAEAERRLGRTAPARQQLERLERIASSLPRLLQTQLQLMLLLAKGDPNPSSELDAFVARSGVPALALLLPPAATGAQSFEPLVNEVVAIVRACQTADEEIVVLRDVCGRVRHDLHAAAAAFIVGASGRCEVLASDGARSDTQAAERAIAAGIVIQPRRHGDRIEAAAPLQYGGVTIGALSVRWTLGSTYDYARTTAVIATAAAAAAPVVSAAIARRERIATAAPQILGATAGMVDLRRQVDRAASAPFPVLICGESGSGKELIAQAIHRGSQRRGCSFRALNCAAIPEDLADAELFGHVRGSFTGAVGDRAGVFEEARGGTLFLDEVGELSARAQAKLLRVIQEGEIRRVGESVSRRVDVRVVAATNRDLHADALQERFRSDLLYRLDVIRITVPPLRDRPEDIPQLVDHYWREATARIGSHAALAAPTIAALARYRWPGNVRELQNVLAALAVRCPKRGVVHPTALPPQFGAVVSTDAWRLDEARRSFEERFIRAALVRSGGHRGHAAVELGVTRQGLTKLMTRLGIS